MTFTRTNRISARVVALITAFSMIMSAFPASFFGFNFAEAANTDAVGTITVTALPDAVAPVDDREGEYFTIDFAGTGTLNLDGWNLDERGNDLDYTFASVMLADGESYKVCASASSTENGGMTDCDDDWGGNFKFNNGGDDVILTDDTATTVLSFTYASAVEGVTVSDSGPVDFTPPACTPQFDAASSTLALVQNTNSGDYFDSLQDAIADCDTEDGDALEVLGDITATTSITVSKELSIDGNGYTISPTFMMNDTDDNAVFRIVGTDNVELREMTIDGSGGTSLHGINVYESTGITLFEMTITDNDHSGLVVNGSEVTVTDFTSSGHGWHGINVAQGSGVTDPAVLTVNETSTHTEPGLVPHIFIDDISQDVTVTDVDSQYEANEFPFRGGTARAYYLKAPVVEEVATIRVCKILLDADGMITDGSDIDATFAVDVHRGTDFATTTTFTPALTLNTDLVTDNGSTNDAACVSYEVTPGQYHYEPEVITSEQGWLAPRYHDFFSSVPETLSDFGVFTADGEASDNDDADGVINLAVDQTRTIAIVNQMMAPVAEPPAVCTAAGQVVSALQGTTNNGSPVAAERSLVSAVEIGVAPYANFLGTEGNDWQVDPLDFYSLGIGGDVTFQFTEAVAIDQPGPDIAIWEITGGTSQVTGESAEVSVSQDGITFYEVGSITGDGVIDIADIPVAFVQYVTLRDTSAGVQGPNGDGFDLDAITIIEGACADFATVVAHKIVCTDESQLPNWGTGGPNVHATTATDWVAQNDSCTLQSGWEFQWSPQASFDPGDTVLGSAAAPWVTLPPTNDDGFSTVVVPASVVAENDFLRFREVLQPGYIPFTHHDARDNSNDVSAELYCHTDVRNYDNDDRIRNLATGTTYHCVAWNHLPEEATEATLEIVTPTPLELVSGLYEFTAEYVDDDEEIDDIKWAIRAGSCDISANTVAGNVDGFADTSSYADDLFAATLDTSLWANGEYCFVVNPTESPDEVDLRDTQLFTVMNNLVCEPGVNLVKNPSFELDLVTKSRGWDLFDTITDWMVEKVGGGVAKAEIQAGVFGWTSSDGDQHIELGSDTATEWSQTVLTKPGETYTLTLDYAARPETEKPESRTEVYIDGQLIEKLNEDGGDDIDWTTFSYTFTATSSSVEISFADTGITNSRGGLIDNVSLACNPEKYTIDGYKWNDLDADGYWDENEPAIPGWEIYLESEWEDESTMSTTTDENGYYYFDVYAGAWEVSEEYRSGWMQTAPRSEVFRATAVRELVIEDEDSLRDDSYPYRYPYQMASCYYQFGAMEKSERVFSDGPYNPEECNFGNHQELFLIDGYKYNDVDADGAMEIVDAGLAGWEITAYNSETEQSVSTTTDENGYYYFNVPAGPWEVRETLQTDWEQIAVYENGLLVASAVEASTAYCSFNFSNTFSDMRSDRTLELVLSDDTVEPVTDDARCDFYNREDTGGGSTSNPGGLISRTSSGGGGGSNGPIPQVLGATTANTCPFLLDHMQLGWENDAWEVIKLQLFLSLRMGYENPVTGVFDDITDQNVKRFQETYADEVLTPWFNAGIVPHQNPTGFVYKTTKWKINDLVCPGDPFPDFAGEDLTNNIDID